MEQLESDLRALRAGAAEWAGLSIAGRIEALKALRPGILEHARRWVEAAAEAKGLPPGSPTVGEEWMTGPYAVLYAVNRYVRTLEHLDRTGDVGLPAPVRARPDGTHVARVFPASAYDKLLFSGVTADVWLPQRVSTARYYRSPVHEPRVALVLGAGNVAAIGPLDVLYKLVADGAVCMLKMNPVNDYLAPVYRDVFAPLIARNFLRIVTGGTQTGAFLTAHPQIEEIHITGSGQTYDAIVFGGSDKSRRRLEKPVTAELGNVSPTIVVPGRWTDADLRFQAEHIVTQKLHNAGFNCIAAQVVILARDWEQRERFEQELQRAFARVKARPDYYPGAAARRAAIGAGEDIIVRVDAQNDHAAFTTEAFSAVLALTALPGANPGTFLHDAVTFANERLAGTLGANVIIDPQTQRNLGTAFDDAVAALRYGAVGINAWTGVAFLLAESTWGAYPGHTPEDIQSGTGIVHNAFLFDEAYKTVVSAPFRPFPRGLLHGSGTLLPKPPWFVSHRRSAAVGERLLAFEAAPSVLKLAGLFLDALRA